MLNLKQNNERLQRLVRPRSLAGSHASLSGATPPGPAPSGNTPLGSGPGEDARRFSAADAQRSSNDTHVKISNILYIYHTICSYLFGQDLIQLKTC